MRGAAATAVLALLGAPPLGAAAHAQPAAATAAPAGPDPNVPAALAEDQNMRAIDFNPNARTRLVGSIGRATVVAFAAEEEVVRVIFGDGGKAWEGPDPAEIKEAPLGNVLYLFPREAGYTSLQVVTRGPRGNRVYQFAAEARPLPAACTGRPGRCDDPDATYGLHFRYPQDEAAARAAEQRRQAEERRRLWEAEAPLREARRDAAQQAAMRGRLDTDPFVGGACRNWRYEAEANDAGRARIVPDRVTDNGQETALVFEGNRPVPAFYVVGADGATETPVRGAQRGHDTVVLPVVAPEIRLRLGEAVVHLYNRNILPPSCVPGTFTTSPDVARVLRQDRQAAPAGPAAAQAPPR